MWYGLGRLGYGAAHALPWLGWIAPILMVLFWAAVVTALVLLIRNLVRQSRAGRHDSTALEILKTRYAKGEIGKEEFDQKRRDLD